MTVGWKVSLSNGQTLYEGKGDFCVIPGELSPWNRLVKYVSENNLTITSLSLYTDNGRTFNLPSAGNNPKFHAFAVAEKPLGFNFCNKMAQDALAGNGMPIDLFAVIEAMYTDYTLQIWVDRNNPDNCWSLIAGA